ncbi:MAG: Rpn family recombination-promoting nuclease/putative transposase [Turicibacter sp.]|nr:Rpn family recombination-promoting nuclease/putative transposase [Turicibacter sp.]
MSKKSGRLLPTTALGFVKAFATEGKEHLPLAFINDVLVNDVKKFRKKVKKLKVGNPYNIIEVNKLSEEGILKYLMNTELDLYCITDDGQSFCAELQNRREEYYEERIFHNTILKYQANYARIYDTKSDDDSQSKYASLMPTVSLNILGYDHFDTSEAIHFFRLYDVMNQKYPLKANRYIEIFFEFKKDDERLSTNLKHWQHFFQTGEALPEAPNYIKELSTMMEIANLTQEERRVYEASLNAKYKRMNREMYVEKRGEKKKAIEMAKAALENKLPTDLISKLTGLPTNVISSLETN